MVLHVRYYGTLFKDTFTAEIAAKAPIKTSTDFNRINASSGNNLF